MQQTFRCFKCGSQNVVGRPVCICCHKQLGTTTQIVMLRLNPIIEFLIRVIKITPVYDWLVKWALTTMKRDIGSSPPHIFKQTVLKEYSKRYGLKILVETGTYLGDMVEAMRADFDLIYSIELSKDLYEKAMIRFKGVNNIEIIQGDSGIELPILMNKINQPALFWLDGHYSGGITARGNMDTPIFEELNTIFNHFDTAHVILIDDARCFEKDPCYPSMEELIKFIGSKKCSVEIVVQDDIIRICPQPGKLANDG